MYYVTHNEISILTPGLVGEGYSLYKDGFPFIDHTHKYRIIVCEEKFKDLADRISKVPQGIISREVCFSSMRAHLNKHNSIFETENIEDIINLEQTHPEIFY